MVKDWQSSHTSTPRSILLRQILRHVVKFASLADVGQQRAGLVITDKVLVWLYRRMKLHPPSSKHATLRPTLPFCFSFQPNFGFPLWQRSSKTCLALNLTIKPVLHEGSIEPLHHAELGNLPRHCSHYKQRRQFCPPKSISDFEPKQSLL